jgi:hypothetical protein
MPFTPTSPALTELSALTDAKALLAEFAAYWFDGTAKPLGVGSNVAWPTIPAENIRFDVDREHHGDVPALRFVLIPGAAQDWESGVEGETLQQRDHTLQVTVSAQIKAGDATWKNGNYAADLVAGRLVAVLRNKATRAPLGLKGLRVLQVWDGVPVPNEDGPTIRIVTARVRFIFHSVHA